MKERYSSNERYSVGIFLTGDNPKKIYHRRRLMRGNNLFDYLLKSFVLSLSEFANLEATGSLIAGFSRGVKSCSDQPTSVEF